MHVLRPLARIWTALLALAALALVLGLVVRGLLPVSPWIASPSLNSNAPLDGATGVLPRSEIVLRFSAPMNHATTQAALRLTPATSGSFRWSDDSRQLTFSPEGTFEPDTDYSLSIDGAALGHWWQPLAGSHTIRFRTAPLPAVVAAIPNTDGVPLASALAIVFSQAMIRAEQVNQPVSLPQLQIDPPLSSRMRWIDQTTLLVQPDAPLRAASHYTATIAADLTDLRGVDLGRPFSWSWSTAWPEALSYAPANHTDWVGPHQPLVLTLSAALDPDLLQTALALDPPSEHEISSAQIGATQVVTLTPRLGWEYGRSYQVRFVADDPALVAPPDLAWSFRVGPEPGLIAFSPGQGQTLGADQDVRMIFSTPMDEAGLRAGLRIDPPVRDLSLQVNERAVQLRPSLQPSQVYTLTLAADTRDRSGEPLGLTETVQLRAAPAEPALSAPTASANVIDLQVGQVARIELERINLSRLDLSLYQLDTPTLVRALNMAPAEWRSFDPERYGQILANSWSMSLNDPVDTLVRTPITLADGKPLAAGIYYLRVLSREGPRTDLLLQVSSLSLALRQSDSQVLVWATERASGKPVAEVPLLLYAGEALISRGQTGAGGVWHQPIQRPIGAAPYLVIADTAAPAIVRGDWLAVPIEQAPPRYRSVLWLNQPTYRPGDSVQVEGLTRIVGTDGSIGLPETGSTCRTKLESDRSPTLNPRTACTLSASGTVSGTLQLPSDLPSGDYRLLVLVGDSTNELALHVADQETDAELEPSESGGQVLLRATRSDRPFAGAPISWTIELEPLVTSENPDGFSFAPASNVHPASSGVGTTDSDGELRVPLPTSPAQAGVLRYRLRAELLIGDQHLASIEHSGAIRPGGVRVGLRLPGRVSSEGERTVVELLSIDGDDRPAPGQRIEVAVYRSGDAGGSALLRRSAVSDEQGRAEVQLVQLRPGAYEIVARLGDQSSSASLWVAGAGYTGWQNPAGQVLVLSDRASYRPGDVARLLVTTPYARANLLLSTEHGGQHSAEVRELAAGELISLVITPELAPGVNIGVVVASGAERLVGATAIRVDGEPAALVVDLATDSQQYAPAGTATLTISTSIAGVPTAAALLVALAPADAPEARLDLVRFEPARPALSVALLPREPVAPTSAAGAPAPLAGAAGYLVAAAPGASGGQTVLRVPLPAASGRWRISAYAVAGAGSFAVASATVTSNEPVELSAAAPPALRAGDRAEASLLLRNSSAISQSLRVRLLASGGELDPATPSEQQLQIAPGTSQRLIWLLSPRKGADTISLSYRVDGIELNAQLTRNLVISVLEPVETPTDPGGAQTDTRIPAAPIILDQEYLDPSSGMPLSPAELHVGQLVAVRISVISADPISHVRIVIPLPAGLQPIKLEAAPAFVAAGAVDTTSRVLQAEAAGLGPGVYSLSVLLCATSAGEFSAPGAHLLVDELALPPVVAATSSSRIRVERGAP